MADKVFVSPGVYTSERDLSYVTRSVGVTTLGVVGETTQGPAFQPIFVSNYDEFKSFFGGLNATKDKVTGAPKYELPYIAKSYLSQSNQLFVTRVLGLSGYYAGLSWGITLDANMDPSTIVESTPETDYTNLMTFDVDIDDNLTNVVIADADMESFYTSGLIDGIDSLATASVGDAFTFNDIYRKVGSNFEGISINLEVTGVGEVSGSTTHFEAESYADVENKLVALLRSRGSYDNNEILNFEVDDSNNIGFDSSVNDAASLLTGDFSITGTSTTSGQFSYSLSLDRRKKNYLPKVLGRTPQDGKTAIFVEELYSNMLLDLMDSDKVRGVKIDNLVDYGTQFSNYRQQYQPAVTPWVVSELRGTNLLKLFRLWTISDGNTANKQFKISIKNINLSTLEFDVEVRAFYDTDAKPTVLERFTRCTMNPTSNNYIAKRIGTLDGSFNSVSNYILVEMNEETNVSDAFPAGFLGYPIKDYQSNNNPGVLSPTIEYKNTYNTFENKRKLYLGLSETKGIDQDFFNYNGMPYDEDSLMYTGLTKGFHMDKDANSATIDGVEVVIDTTGGTYSPMFEFEVGADEFRDENGVQGTSYEKSYARKFTFAPYGGFDGWDEYRTTRTNKDSYIVNGSKGSAGLVNGNFSNISLTNGDSAINSDYYAYLEAIWTFNNPEAVNINVFTTPGIDTFNNTNLVEETIEMVEQDRADSIYIVTTPDTDASGEVLLAEDVADQLDGMFDSNYTATYWPWVQVNDNENNVYLYMPPTRDVVRNIALTDSVSFPWFAVAGVNRGDVNAIKARKKLTQTDRNVLYDARINPLTTFTTEGVKIWGNKTLQVKESALDRLSVRRLLLQARKLISAVSIRLLFEQNDAIVRNQFLSLVNPILDNIRAERGLSDFKVVLDVSPESIDRNELCGRIFLKPTRALEFICVEFNVMNTGASFEDI